MTSADERPARLDVGVVGAGRVGAVLGAALQRVGHRVVAVSGVSEQSRTRAAQLLPGTPVVAPDDVVRRAELVVLAVPDDALADLVAGLAATRHVAGRASSSRTRRGGTGWRSTRRPCEQHVLGLALHPAMTFTGTGLDLERLVECCFGVTAPEPLRPVAEALVLEIGAEPVWIEESARPLYHAPSPTGPTTSSRWSRSRCRRCGRPASTSRRGCSGRWCPRRSTTPCVRVTLPSPGRWRAAMRVPLPSTCDSCQGLSPDIRPTYVALARATAERALASGRLEPHVAEPLLDILATDQERQ